MGWNGSSDWRIISFLSTKHQQRTNTDISDLLTIYLKRPLNMLPKYTAKYPNQYYALGWCLNVGHPLAVILLPWVILENDWIIVIMAFFHFLPAFLGQTSLGFISAPTGFHGWGSVTRWAKLLITWLTATYQVHKKMEVQRGQSCTVITVSGQICWSCQGIPVARVLGMSQ